MHNEGFTRADTTTSSQVNDNSKQQSDSYELRGAPKPVNFRKKMNLNMELTELSHLYIFLPQKSTYNCRKRKAYQNKVLTTL